MDGPGGGDLMGSGMKHRCLGPGSYHGEMGDLHVNKCSPDSEAVGVGRWGRGGHTGEGV